MMHHQAHPMLHYQPGVLPRPRYNNYQPNRYGYIPFVYQTTPQTPYYATTIYNPITTYYPSFPCHAPFMPTTQSHSVNSGDSLRGDIRKQIEYYFSDENLNKPDRYLMSLMDEKGWVPVPAIAGFRRVNAMCKSVTFILESLLDSSVVEVRGNKIRRRDVWSKWISSAKR